MKRPRNKEGKFQQFSQLSDKTIGCRIYKKDEEVFYSEMDKKGITGAELIREIVHNWAKNKYE